MSFVIFRPPDWFHSEFLFWMRCPTITKSNSVDSIKIREIPIPNMRSHAKLDKGDVRLSRRTLSMKTVMKKN